jgi:predicted membrane protein
VKKSEHLPLVLLLMWSVEDLKTIVGVGLQPKNTSKITV